MSKLTDFLKLHIWEIPTDNKQQFNYPKAIAENFEKLDANAKEVNENKLQIDKEISNLKEEDNKTQQENEQLKSQIPTGQSSGEEITLNDSSNLPFKELKVVGNSFQETDDTKPSPDNRSEIKNCGDNINLFDESKWELTDVDEGKEVLKFSGYYDIKTGAKAGNPLDFPVENLKQGETYTISVRAKKTTYDTALTIMYEDLTIKSYNLASDYQLSTVTFTLETDKKVLHIFLSAGAIGTYNFALKNTIKFEKGAQATPYSLYNCGNVNFKVCNENFIDMDKFESSLITSRTKNSITSRFTSIATNGGNASFKISPKKYFMSVQIESNAQVNLPPRIEVRFYKNNSQIGKESVFTENFKIDNSEGIYDEIRVILSNGTYINGEVTFKNLMLKIDDEKTEFIEHQEQKATFPTKEGQVFHKGDYLADDGVHHKRKTIELTGNENWVAGSSKICYWFKFYDDSKKITAGGIDILCSHWKKKTSTNNDKGVFLNNISFNATTKYLVIYTIDELTTLEEFTSYLKQQKANGTPVVVEYELEEEIIEPYNEEQQEAHDKKKELTGYKNVTHIFSEDEIKLSYEVTYYKDLETLLGVKSDG